MIIWVPVVLCVCGIIAMIVIPVAKSRKPTRSPLTNCWVKREKRWYFVGADGLPRTNEWVETDGLRYYVGQDGVRLQNTTTTIDGRIHRFAPDGHRLGA